MKKLFLAGIAFIALGAGSSALAADLRVPYKAPPVIETWSWTGFYVGVHFGAAWGTKQQTITTFDTSPVPVTQSSHTVNGWLGGGQVGFNYQVDRWVWGVEAQFSWSDIDGVGLCNVIGINTCRTKIDWLGTAALRLGFTIDHALVYVKGGAAWVHDKYDTDIQGQATTFGSASETRWGWMFGTGVEYAVTRAWSAKIEYNYLDFGTKDVQYSNEGPEPAGTAIRGPVPTKERIHLIKFGVNYRFGWGPVVAAY